MFNTIKMFFLNRDKPTKVVRESYSPPMGDLAILDAEDLKFENRVIDFLNKKKPYALLTIDPDTGMFFNGDMKSSTHWSEFFEFAPYARAVTVRTTNWNEKVRLIEKDAIGTTVEAVGAKKLRFYVPFETQLDFLENKSSEDHLLMFERDVIHNLSFSIKVINPAELGIITPDHRAMYIEYDGAIYWNSNYQNLSPVEEALIKDYAFFEFHSENPNVEKKNYD